MIFDRFREKFSRLADFVSRGLKSPSESNRRGSIPARRPVPCALAASVYSVGHDTEHSGESIIQITQRVHGTVSAGSHRVPPAATPSRESRGKISVKCDTDEEETERLKRERMAIWRWPVARNRDRGWKEWTGSGRRDTCRDRRTLRWWDCRDIRGCRAEIATRFRSGSK